ncbi:hypothetical protein HA402_014713 [Bradysia odoriphaga]|nr:hypothetical protein HA402_014713 [Bradysia odoriphaga]
MGEQQITVVVEDRNILIKYDVSTTLGVFRQFLIDQKYILIDAEGDTWVFQRVIDGKVTETAHVTEEKYIPVSEYIYDTNKISVGNLKVRLEVFADTLHEFYRFDVSQNLGDLRKFLIEKPFIKADVETSAWRFVSPSGKDLKDITEAIIGIEIEGQVVVKNFLYGSKKIRMVDIRRKKNPDLVGVGVDFLEDRDIELRIVRNDSNTPTKLAPILMKNVRPANKHGVRTDFENVVLCEKETAIGIRINTKTHGGFAYSIKLQEGKDIVTHGYSPHTGWTTYAYDGTRNAIEVVSYKDLEIPSQQAIGHRRLNVKVWRYISCKYSTDNKTYIVDSNAPKRRLKRDVVVVPGDRVEGGGFTEGGDTENYVGSGYIYDMVEDTNEILGEFDVDFFVFKTPDDAQNMVESRIDPEFE